MRQWFLCVAHIVLDEVGNGKDELKLLLGQKTILTVYLREDRFTFLIIFGKKEREVFEEQKENFLNGLGRTLID